MVLDRRDNKSADTGKFELAFKDSAVTATKCVDTKFIVEGQRIRRGELAKYNQIDQEENRKKVTTEQQNKKQSGPPKVRIKKSYHVE